MIVEIGGVKEVVTLTQKNAVGLSLAAGELLWKIDFPGRSGMNIPTPLRFGQRLILAGDPGTMLVQVNKSGGSWTAEKAWQISELTMRFSSPVQKGNLIFGVLKPQPRHLLLRRRGEREDAVDQRPKSR